MRANRALTWARAAATVPGLGAVFAASIRAWRFWACCGVSTPVVVSVSIGLGVVVGQPREPSATKRTDAASWAGPVDHWLHPNKQPRSVVWLVGVVMAAW